MTETAKRRVGRPAKYGSSSLDAGVHLRLPGDERQRLDSWAGLLGITVSEVFDVNSNSFCRTTLQKLWTLQREWSRQRHKQNGKAPMMLHTRPRSELSVPSSDSINAISVDADTSELLSIWSALDELARRDLLSVARSLGGPADATGRR